MKNNEFDKKSKQSTSGVVNNKTNKLISIKNRLDKIERCKKSHGSESNQYIIIALTEITSILRDYFNINE